MLLHKSLAFVSYDGNDILVEIVYQKIDALKCRSNYFLKQLFFHAALMKA